MFVIDRNKELVGHSQWPWDALYAPVVGCFRDGRLIAFAVCNREPQRVKMDGPRQRAWFRMAVDGDVRESIELGDQSIVLLRLEDGAPVRFAERGVEDAPLQSVEDLVTRVHTPRPLRLEGFPSFVAAPAVHQLDVMFLDYLNRLPDPEARGSYLNQINRGVSILDVRDIIMSSEEFKRRDLTVSDAVGALITSSIWQVLRQAEPLGMARPTLDAIRISRYAEAPDREFVRSAHRDVHGDDPSEEGVIGLAELAAIHGRSYVMSLLVRDAANGGTFYELIDD